MRIKYESEDGKVSGYGDEGKAAVEAYEADPWVAWRFPWGRNRPAGWVYDSCPTVVKDPMLSLAAVAFSKMVPVIQDMVAVENRLGWKGREGLTCVSSLEAILKETLDASRQ